TTRVLVRGERRVRLALHGKVDAGRLCLLGDDLHIADVVGVTGDDLQADGQRAAIRVVEHAVRAELVAGCGEDAPGLVRVVVHDLRVAQRRVVHRVVVRREQGFGVGRRGFAVVYRLADELPVDRHADRLAYGEAGGR